MRLKWESHRISYQGWRGNLLALYVCEALDLISRTTEQLNDNAAMPEGWPKRLRPMQKTQFDSLLTPQFGPGQSPALCHHSCGAEVPSHGRYQDTRLEVISEPLKEELSPLEEITSSDHTA